MAGDGTRDRSGPRLWKFAAKTGGFGSGEQGFEFGEFAVAAGRVYEVEAIPGPVFGTWARARPRLEVGVNRPGPSLFLPWVQDFSRPIALILASLGLLFLGGTVWTMRR